MQRPFILAHTRKFTPAKVKPHEATKKCCFREGRLDRWALSTPVFPSVKFPNCKMPSHSRYFRNRIDLAGERLEESQLGPRIWNEISQLVKRIERYVAQGRGLSSGGAIYTGLGGIALMYFHLAARAAQGVAPPQGIPDLDENWNEKRLLQRAYGLCVQAERLTETRMHRVTFLEGRSGCLAVKCAALDKLGKGEQARAAKESLLECVDQVAMLDAGECEVLYGKCGFLYSLLFVRHHLGDDGCDSAIESLAQQVMDEGKSCASSRDSFSRFGMMFAWHKKHYLGAIHGLAGIFHTLNLCLPYIHNSDLKDQIRSLTHKGTSALIDDTFPSGNLPSSFGRNRDELVQFCHGVPGLVPLLCMYLGPGREQFTCEDGNLKHKCDELLERVRNDIWRRGLLHKGVGLCHGISGNGYAFLNMYKAKRHETYLQRARGFADFILQNWKDFESIPDRQPSLYEGLAGAVCFLIDVLNPELAAIPGYQF